VTVTEAASRCAPTRSRQSSASSPAEMLGRTHKITEHHGDVSALANRFYAGRRGWHCSASIGALLPASTRRAACPSAVTPSSFRSSAVKPGRTDSSISFSRKIPQADCRDPSPPAEVELVHRAAARANIRYRKRREDTVAKGQLRSNREKKKPKAENNKKKSAPVPSGLARTNDWERRLRQEVLVAQSASAPPSSFAVISCCRTF
jgi:hypothetical protein